jgi:hypothetical protein
MLSTLIRTTRQISTNGIIINNFKTTEMMIKPKCAIMNLGLSHTNISHVQIPIGIRSISSIQNLNEPRSLKSMR